MKLLNNIIYAFKRFDKFITDAVILFYEGIIEQSEKEEKQLKLLSELDEEKKTKLNAELRLSKSREEQQTALRKYGVII